MDGLNEIQYFYKKFFQLCGCDIDERRSYVDCLVFVNEIVNEGSSDMEEKLWYKLKTVAVSRKFDFQTLKRFRLV